MLLRAYIWVEGGQFNPKAFQASLPSKDKGEIAARKRVDHGEVRFASEYWKSKEVEATSTKDLVSRAHQLLEIHRDGLSGIRALNCNTTLQLVSHAEDVSEVAGINLPVELIRLLSELGSSLDFDQYVDN